MKMEIGRVNGASYSHYGLGKANQADDPMKKKTSEIEDKSIEKDAKSIEKDAKSIEKDAKIAAEVSQLVIIEKKVIAHEQAHKSVGGEFTGAMSYSYTNGPDGKRYITGGEVSISIPSTDDKAQMIRMLERVKNAALAPADPSGQDLKVAASASAKQMAVRADLAKEKTDENAKGRQFDQSV